MYAILHGLLLKYRNNFSLVRFRNHVRPLPNFLKKSTGCIRAACFLQFGGTRRNQFR
jgi:hypothetical protein